MPHPAVRHDTCVMSGGQYSKRFLNSRRIILAEHVLAAMVDDAARISRTCSDPVCAAGSASSGPCCATYPPPYAFHTATLASHTPSATAFDIRWQLAWSYTMCSPKGVEHGCVARVATSPSSSGAVGFEWVEGKRLAADGPGPLAVFASFREVAWHGEGEVASACTHTVVLFDDHRRMWVRLRGPHGECSFVGAGQGVPTAPPTEWIAFHATGTWTARKLT